MAMAIEVLPDSPNVAMSPARISFSHDLSRNDAVVVSAAEHHTRSANSAIEFDFCVFRESFEQEYSSSSADELFFDGKILPIEIKKKLPPPPPIRAAPPPPPAAAEIEEEKQNNNKTSSFWGFKRSTSLNCGSDYARKLCPLPLLSRSNSTGSTPAGGGGGAKRSSQLSNNQKQNFGKCSTTNSSLKQYSSSTNHQKPPLKKSSYGSYSNNAVKFNPVLNVTPANLFGLGLIFSGGKDRSKKR